MLIVQITKHSVGILRAKIENIQLQSGAWDFHLQRKEIERIQRGNHLSVVYNNKKRKLVKGKRSQAPARLRRPLVYDDRRRRWIEDADGPPLKDQLQGNRLQKEDGPPLVVWDDPNTIQTAIHIDEWREEIWATRKRGVEAVAAKWDEWRARFVDLTTEEESAWRE